MKVLVTGIKGQLGYDVIKHLERRKVSCVGVDIGDFDLTDRDEVHRYIKNYEPDAVIHCAAYTAVDRAEEDRDACYAVNVGGTQNVASVCREIGAKMIYISTDYVFEGTGDRPYETDDRKDPQGYYGLTKSLGEDVVQKNLERYFIVRTAWVFGRNGNNFVKTMLRLGRERDELRVVADQFGSPTYTEDLAPLLCDMIETDRYGVYHATNEGFCNWFEFASEIMKKAGLGAKVIPIRSEDYPTKAIRPKNSRLSKESLDASGFSRLPSWENALERYLDEN